MKRIALIGDYNEAVVAHRAIPIALRMAVECLNVDTRWDWLHTAMLETPAEKSLHDYTAVWCVPGSPYKNTHGVIEAIRYARIHSLPFLGTCGGFQHAIMEYAEAVWGIDAMHAETDPHAVDPVIAPLVCSLLSVSNELHFERDSRLRKIYGRDSTHEEYQCSYGFNALYVDRFNDSAMKIVARDDEGSVRAIELDDYPFFIATLFQPERAALKDQLPPLVKAFVAAISIPQIRQHESRF